MKRTRRAMEVVLFLCLSCFLLPPAVFAQDLYGNYYRDTRIFGKVINDHIVYGTLYFRANDGSFVQYANKTYWMVQPYNPDDIYKIQSNIDKAVILTGRMLDGQAAGQEVIAFYNVEPANYNIELNKGVYFGRLKTPNQLSGFSLDPITGMGDLLSKLKKISMINFKKPENFQSEIANFSNNITPVWMLPENSNVEADLDKRTDLLVIVRGNTGSNFLDRYADVSEGHIKNFINNFDSYSASGITRYGSVTICGRIKIVRPYKAPAIVYITGVTAKSIDQWSEIFKHNPDSGAGFETFRTGLSVEEVEDGELMFMTGDKVYIKQYGEDCINATTYLKGEEVLLGLENLRQLTN